MKKIFTKISSKKGLSALLVAGVLVLVLILNLAVGIFVFRGRVLTDLTEEGLYTVDPIYRTALSDTFRIVSEKRAESGDEPVRVRILFCEDPDVLSADSAQRYIYFTALSLQQMFPDYITVDCVDVALNPTAVQAYKVNSASKIYPTSVIVSSGTEFRVYSTTSFYYFDSSDYQNTTPIGYCGDKTFVRAIRDVTSAESPVCCLISNHGETYGEAFRDLLRNAGYRVVENFDLRRDKIPEDCRMLISSGAKTDFYAVFGDTEPDGDDEIDKLSAFLDTAGSFLFFFDPGTPKLQNIEEYLTEWGMIIDRSGGEAFRVTDKKNSISADGSTLIGQYETTGLGASILSDMLSTSSPEQVVFPNCGSISRPENYKTTYTEEDKTTGTPSYSYGYYSSGGINRSTFDFFRAGESAEATAGELVSNVGSNRLMTITTETRMIAEDQGYTWVAEASYVMSCASTGFLSDEVLTGTRFGNTDVLLSALRVMGRDVHATDNTYRMFHVSKLGKTVTVPDSDKTQITVWLTVVPAVILVGACVIVMVRRRRKA